MPTPVDKPLVRHTMIIAILRPDHTWDEQEVFWTDDLAPNAEDMSDLNIALLYRLMNPEQALGLEPGEFVTTVLLSSRHTWVPSDRDAGGM